MLSIQRQTNRRSRLAAEPTTIEQSVSAECVGREIKTPRPPPLHLLLFPPHPCCRCFIFSAQSWRRGVSSAAGTRFTHRFTRSRAPPAGSPNTRRHHSPPFPTENGRLGKNKSTFCRIFYFANALRGLAARLGTRNRFLRILFMCVFQTFFCFIAIYDSTWSLSVSLLMFSTRFWLKPSVLARIWSRVVVGRGCVFLLGVAAKHNGAAVITHITAWNNMMVAHTGILRQICVNRRQVYCSCPSQPLSCGSVPAMLQINCFSPLCIMTNQARRCVVQRHAHNALDARRQHAGTTESRLDEWDLITSHHSFSAFFHSHCSVNICNCNMHNNQSLKCWCRAESHIKKCEKIRLFLEPIISV